MDFSFIELFILFGVVGGATKALAYFLAGGKNMTREQRVKTVTSAMLVQVIVLALFAKSGKAIVDFFHVSLPALSIAGGLILFVFALGLVLGSGGDHGHEDEGGGDIGIYPLGVPLLASPQAIVGVTLVFSLAPDAASRMNAWAALAALFALNAAVMFGAAFLMRGDDGNAKKSGGVSEVLLRVVAILLCALAVELVLKGLVGYGVITLNPVVPPAAMSAPAH